MTPCKGSAGIALAGSISRRIHHLMMVGKRQEIFTACQNQRASCKIRNDIS
jgi:hypothetical protein